MQRHAHHPRHQYRLLLDEDRKGCAQRIEFEAPDTRQAMALARSCLRGRDFALYEDGTLLGRFTI
jgi:hypothetical protein